MLNKKSIIIIVLLLAVVALGVSIFMKNTGFRVLSQDPKGDVAMSSTLITLTLSDTPANKDEVKVSIKPEVKGLFTLKENTIAFEPSEPFENNNNYTISIENVKLNNSNSIHNTKHAFKAIYVPYDNLSQEEKDRQLAKTNPHYQKYPITKVLPYTTSSYMIEYTLPTNSTEKLLLVITPLIEQGRGESTEQYHTRLLAIKNDAEAYIESNNFKMTDFNVYYPDFFLMQYSSAFPNDNE